MIESKVFDRLYCALDVLQLHKNVDQSLLLRFTATDKLLCCVYIVLLFYKSSDDHSNVEIVVEFELGD